jgi:hypothetical protein
MSFLPILKISDRALDATTVKRGNTKHVIDTALNRYPLFGWIVLFSHHGSAGYSGSSA